METNSSDVFKVAWRGIGLLVLLSPTLAIPGMSYAQIPPEVKQCIETATITEDNMLNGPNDCRGKLMDYMKDNWATVLDNLGTIAPKKSEQIVVMRAAESLSPQDYLSFLNRTHTLRLSGAIDEDVFDRILLPSRYKQGYLEVNYQNSAVQDFLRDARPLVKPKMRTRFDEILTGKAKKELEDEWEAYHEKPSELDLLLPATISSRRDHSETAEIWVIGLISATIVVGLLLWWKGSDLGQGR